MSRIIFGSKLSGETAIYTFDFTSRLTSAETISTATITAAVYSGTDASPSSIVSGSATISGKTVTQPITAGTEGVTYTLVATITTSLSQTLQLTAFLTVVPDPA
ncbi:MAG: hypothetical protein U1E51_21840 [Candidatus Binatia bacterium]|nr:hypothetical protein [Candidatus Binatia bacterium]